MGWRDFTDRTRDPVHAGSDLGSVLTQLRELSHQLRHMESTMATRAELDKINAAISNLATQVSAVVASIQTNTKAAQDAHDADDDTALESALSNINAQADALKAITTPATAAVAEATPST